MQSNIRAIAREMVKRDGLINLSRSAISEAAGIPDGSFPHYLGCSFAELVKEFQNDPKLMREQPANKIVNKSRVSPSLRKEQLLLVAVDLAKRDGYANVTRAAISELAGVSEALVSHYFGGMNDMKEAIMREAVDHGVIEIVAQGLGAGDPLARLAPESVKQEAIQLMMSV